MAWKEKITNSIRNKLLLYFGVLFIVSQIIVFVFVNGLAANLIETNAFQSVRTGGKALRNSISLAMKENKTAARILANDFAFKRAFATLDLKTIESALKNQRKRVGSELLFVFGMDGKFLAEANGIRLNDGMFDFDRLKGELAENQSAARLKRIGNSFFQIIMVTINSPDPVAVMGVGFEISDEFLGEFKDISNLDFTFLKSDRDVLSVLKSSKEELSITWLDGVELGIFKDTEGRMEPFSRKEETLLMLPFDGNDNLYILLHKSNKEFYSLVSKARLMLIGIFFLTLVLCSFMVIYFSNSLSRPLQNLKERAMDLAEGNLDVSVPQVGSDEVGQLAQAFRSLSLQLKQRNNDNKMAYMKIQEKRRALEKANEALDLKLKETEVLLEISEDTNQISSPDDLMTLILKKSMSLFRTSYGAILVYDEKSELLKIVSRCRPDDLSENTKDKLVNLESSQTMVPLTGGIVRKVFDRGEPLVRGHLDLKEDLASYFGIEQVIKSAVAIPLKRFGKTVGVIVFGSETSAPLIARDQVGFLKTVSSHVAVLLQNSDMWFTSINEKKTGLFAENYFFMRLGQELSRSKIENEHFSVMIFELDNYKSILDKVGETMSEVVLKSVADVTKRIGRRQDARVKLSKSEGFAVIFPNCEQSQALLLGEDLRLQIESLKLKVGEHDLQFTASVGISVYPGSGESVDDILENTKLALNVAKEVGNSVRLYEATELDKTQIA